MKAALGTNTYSCSALDLLTRTIRSSSPEGAAEFFARTIYLDSVLPKEWVEEGMVVYVDDGETTHKILVKLKVSRL